MIRTWSYSKLNTWTRCPAQFRFRYLDEAPVEEVGAALLLGSAVHHAVALFHSRRALGRTLDDDELVEDFDAVFRSSVTHAEAPVVFPRIHPDLQQTLDLGRRMLAVYGEHAHQGQVAAVEQDLTCRLVEAAGVEITGVIDRIETDGDGSLRVVELKTAARALSQTEADLSDQVTIYSALLAAHGHDDVKLRYEILTKAKKPRLVILDTRRTPDDLRRLRERTDEVRAAVHYGVFPRNVAPQNCRNCPYRRRCGVSGI